MNYSSQITPTGTKKHQQKTPQLNLCTHPKVLRRMKISCIDINDDKTIKLFKQ